MTNSQIIIIDLFKQKKTKLTKNLPLNEYVSVTPALIYQKDDQPPPKKIPAFRLKKRVQPYKTEPVTVELQQNSG